jgi:hypothetical protein
MTLMNFSDTTGQLLSKTSNRAGHQRLIAVVTTVKTMKITTANRLYMKSVEARRTKIKAMRDAGVTWKAIAATLGITRQRAQQIHGKK